MSRTIPSHKLALIHEECRAKVKLARNKGELDPLILVNGPDIICLLDEVRQRRRKPPHESLGKTTLLLIYMKVGDSVEVPPITQSALSTARKTARKRMNQLDANWHGETTPFGTTRLTRLPNGSDKVFGRPPNPAIAQMAKMKIEDVIIVKGKMYNDLKVTARRLMDCGEANWKCVALTRGRTQVTRIS